MNTEIKSPHHFHIPVMGLAFTIDTPIKVAQYGINSVVSIIEHEMLETMRELICKQNGIGFFKIPSSTEDYVAKRITAYLNTLKQVVDQQMENNRKYDYGTHSNFDLYFEYLPDDSDLKKKYLQVASLVGEEKELAIQYLKANMVAGSIDVNIMTKVDKFNYDKEGNVMPSQYSDALTCLRGYANSDLSSSLILSAGINPRLYSYLSEFEDFYSKDGEDMKKKIVIKVSDFRSAQIQGKFLAKKGIWVSEFRIESGLNCGGHAFATEGLLMGPILEEFKNKREDLYNELYAMYVDALRTNHKSVPNTKPYMRITAQGGVGTAEETNFLRSYFALDSVGWGSPFLLVPETTNVDRNTLKDLSEASPENYFLSHSSPLGVPFNNFSKSSSLHLIQERIENGKAGSPCTKKYLQLNTEFTDTPICTASTKYQTLKLVQLKESAVDEEDYQRKAKAVLEKECLCEGLSSPAYLKNLLPKKLDAVSICPGPNLKYFSGVFSLRQMIDHIYGRANILNSLWRPNLFVNELKLYIDYLHAEKLNGSAAKDMYWNKFTNNLVEGINYYKSVVKNVENEYLPTFKNMETELDKLLLTI